ncbi:MAG: VOC family protein, partial [Ignavibacterium sp.]
GSVMTVEFELNGQKFLAINGGPDFKLNESISLFVYCESDERINFLYEKLSEGGSINMPLDKYDWSPKYAWLKDKFGVSWQIVPTILNELLSDPYKSSKAMNAVFQMVKFDIKKLIEAANE